jgi:hypothetical protein
MMVHRPMTASARERISIRNVASRRASGIVSFADRLCSIPIVAP